MMDEINEDKNDEWCEVYHKAIDYRVSFLSKEDNILILNEYAGGVFEAIKLYENQYGEFRIDNCKHHFYARLVFISIYDK